MIPLAIPDLRGNEAEYLTRCVVDNWVSSAGPDVTAFEEMFSTLTGQAWAVATVNGTAALYLALRAAGVERGSRVIVPDWTFAATANAAIQCGAELVFVDVSAESWTMDPIRLAEALESTDDVSAVMPVHTLGHPADMDPIIEVSARHGVPVIEDAAGAIGARYKDRMCGGMGDAAIFSFNGNKTVTTGGGGMLVTRHEDWARRARHISTQARKSTAYHYDEAGFNLRMPNVNAAMGLAQMERLDEMVTAKKTIAHRYDEAFTDLQELGRMPRCPWADSSCWLYSIKLTTADDAASLQQHLRDAGIEARVFWEALSTQAPYESSARFGGNVAAGLSGTVVSLPCSSQLTEQEQAQVIESVRAWYGAVYP